MNSSRKEDAQRRIKQTKEAARERVVKDGTIQFRLDAANMERLLKLADECKTGAGVLARMWVLDRLNRQIGDAHVQAHAAYPDESQSTSRLVREDTGMPYSLGEAIAIFKTQTGCSNQLIEIAEIQNKELSELRATVREQGERLSKLQKSIKSKSGKAK